MIRIEKSISDAYITNAKIKLGDAKESNTGYSGTLNIFKVVENGVVQYSTALIKFDLSYLKNLYEEEKIDINDSSFWSKISLKDVYGGQTTPRGFSISVSPLKRKFDEGIGKDIVLYTDKDVCNFKYSSYDHEENELIFWDEEGASGSEDFYSEHTINQFFETGEEDLQVDVTEIIKKILLGEISDHGFKISFSDQNLNDERNYFVKRFATRHAYDDLKHPKLFFGFDDSIQDTSTDLTIGFESKFVIKNYFGGSLGNLRGLDGTLLSGEDCIFLRLSGNANSIVFTGSQAKIGQIEEEGVYCASVLLTEDDMFTLNSSSKEKEPVYATWEDSSGFVFSLNRKLFVKRHVVSTTEITGNSLDINATIPEQILLGSLQTVNVFVFNRGSKEYNAKKVFEKIPTNFQGIVSDAFYSIREVSSNFSIIPFDFDKGSTRLSSDTDKLYFNLDSSNLLPNRVYTVDIALQIGGKKVFYKNCSHNFKVVS